MTVKKNREALHSIMSEHNLRAIDVAEALNRTESLVYQWRQRGGYDMPDTMLELLKLKINAGMVPSNKGKHNDNA